MDLRRQESSDRTGCRSTRSASRGLICAREFCGRRSARRLDRTMLSFRTNCSRLSALCLCRCVVACSGADLFSVSVGECDDSALGAGGGGGDGSGFTTVLRLRFTALMVEHLEFVTTHDPKWKNYGVDEIVCSSRVRCARHLCWATCMSCVSRCTEWQGCRATGSTAGTGSEIECAFQMFTCCSKIDSCSRQTLTLVILLHPLWLILDVQTRLNMTFALHTDMPLHPLSPAFSVLQLLQFHEQTFSLLLHGGRYGQVCEVQPPKGGQCCVVLVVSECPIGVVGGMPHGGIGRHEVS